MSVMRNMAVAIGQVFITTTDCPANKIVLRDVAGPRPEPPYVTLGWNTLGQSTGEVERQVFEVGANTVVRHTGPRTATLSIQGYGEVTSDWMEEFKLQLGDVQVTRILATTAGCSVYDSGSVQDITALLDTSRERRYSLDLTVAYDVIKDRTVTPALILESELTLDDEISPPLVTTITID
jgi:hypothetical protein